MSVNLEDMSVDELKAYIVEQEGKEKIADKIQHAFKLLLNSVYGAMGTPYFRMYNMHIAEGITLSGQAAVSQSYSMFNDYLNKKLKSSHDYIVASDTDSAYVDLSRFVNAIIPTDTPHTKKVDAVVKLCDEHFAGMLESTFDEFAEATNAWSNSIDMKREAVATACFVAKKNYVMNVYDNEGTRYASPKQKITGLEAIKSSTPEFLRGKLKEGYHYVFGSTETELQAYVTRTKAEYMALPISKIAGTISVNEIDKFEDGSGGYVSGTPGHVRGAISYNTAIKKMGLGNKYELIRPGDKVKIVPLKLPNPLHATSLCFLSTFPHEIINEKYINRDDNYDKYFVKPITRVIAIAKWKHEYTPSLSELFG